jgi:hypothetical protein
VIFAACIAAAILTAAPCWREVAALATREQPTLGTKIHRAA